MLQTLMDNLPVVAIALFIIILAIGIFTAVKKGAGGVINTTDNVQKTIDGEISNITPDIGTP